MDHDPVTPPPEAFSPSHGDRQKYTRTEPARRARIVTVVSGLPRSGTSLMMQMLEAGGMPVLADGYRPPDADNPRGFYEYEPVRHLWRESAWLEAAQGGAVKIVSPLLHHLPIGFAYKIIFMERAMAEILASQRVMLSRRGDPASAQIDDTEMDRRFRRHLEAVRSWLADRACTEVLNVDFNLMVRGHAVDQVRRITAFLVPDVIQELDEDAMVRVVDPTLYRQREAHP